VYKEYNIENYERKKKEYEEIIPVTEEMTEKYEYSKNEVVNKFERLLFYEKNLKELQEVISVSVQHLNSSKNVFIELDDDSLLLINKFYKKLIKIMKNDCEKIN
jgi:hypothetical protein